VLRTRPVFVDFDPDELAYMRDFREGEVVLQPGDTLFHEGDPLESFYTVLEGLGARYKSLDNGSRQLINFVFPGDIVGLSGSLTNQAMASAEATTAMRLCRFRRSRLPELFRTQPDRGFALTWIAAVEEHFLGETIATLGRRDATERVAWALLRVDQRLEALGLRDQAGGVPFPYRQRDLADALGLSLVHTNKTLARLRPLVQITAGRLLMRNRDAVARLAQVGNEPPMVRPLL